jgi:uncharacterized protein
MIKKLVVISLLSAVFSAQTTMTVAQQHDDVKLLIVDGFSNHDWQRTTKAIIQILDEHEGFDITVSTSPGSQADAEMEERWNPGFSNYDVVLMNCNDLGKPVNWSSATRKSLEDFVSGGGGLYVFHSANNAFENWEEYNKMIGLGWRKRDFGKAIVIGDDGSVKIIPSGEGENTSHGNRVDAPVTRLVDHPVHKGLPQNWIFADIEIYTYARGPAENLTVLTTARDNKFQLNFPIEWVVKYGKGNVYNATTGHFWKDQQHPEGMRCAAFQTIMVRAVRWLAGLDPGCNVPEDFPGTENVSLRDNL